MSSGNMNFIGVFANAITDTLHSINKSITGNDHKHTIDTIYKRNNICVETLESRDSTNEYPRLIKSEGKVLFYKMPIGMSFKQVEKIHDVFESSLRSKVEIIELKDHPNAHFSITISEKTA